MLTPEIKVYPSGKRTAVRKKKFQNVYVVVQEELESPTESIDITWTTIPEVFDTKAKASAYIAKQKFPEEYFILARRLK
jgi:hypothetical protein